MRESDPRRTNVALIRRTRTGASGSCMGLQGDIGPMEAREAVVAHPRRWSEGAERAERAVIVES